MLELSSWFLEFPNNAYILLSQTVIGSSLLSYNFYELIIFIQENNEKTTFRFNMPYIFTLQTIDNGFGSEFFYVDLLGRIRVRNSNRLSSDSGTIYSIQIRAYDSAFPNMRITSSVTIIVNRNPSPPQWQQTSYVFNITDRSVLKLIMFVNPLQNAYSNQFFS